MSEFETVKCEMCLAWYQYGRPHGHTWPTTWTAGPVTAEDKAIAAQIRQRVQEARRGSR